MIAVPKPKRPVVLPEYRGWIRYHACLVLWSQRCSGVVEAAHIRPRRYCDDAAHLIPLCHKHHMAFDQDEGHLTFQRKHGLNVKKIAAALWEKYQSEIGAAPVSRGSP